MNNQIVPGSLSSIAKRDGQSLAETFMSADCVVIVDTSGSMNQNDSRGGRSRYEIACEELRQLQANLPGKIAVLTFSSTVEFCPGGVPLYLGGTTNLARALKFAHVADVPGMRFVVISDGEPDSQSDALTQARKFKARIDVIYVGPEDRPAGRDFLMRLAQASGGQVVTADRAQELAASVERLLLQG